MWRAAGIEKALRARGDEELALKAENAILLAFTLDKDDDESARAIQSFLWELIEFCDGYDSGLRKFEKPPTDEDG